MFLVPQVHKSDGSSWKSRLILLGRPTSPFVDSVDHLTVRSICCFLISSDCPAISVLLDCLIVDCPAMPLALHVRR